jgi:hypothetical protein
MVFMADQIAGDYFHLSTCRSIILLGTTYAIRVLPYLAYRAVSLGARNNAWVNYLVMIRMRAH